MKLSNKSKDILEWIFCIIIAIALALIVRYFIGTPTIVKQPSMYPTLKQDQRLILNRLPRTFNLEFKRGDIITFEAPSVTLIEKEDLNLNNPVAIYNNNPKGLISKFNYYILEFNKISYIKRVIAVSGEHIQIQNGKVFINGKQLEETYLESTVITDSLGGEFTDLIVPEGYVFAMGDNRSQSVDSRRFGCIPINKIESKVFIRFWPFDQFGKVE